MAVSNSLISSIRPYAPRKSAPASCARTVSTFAISCRIVSQTFAAAGFTPRRIAIADQMALEIVMPRLSDSMEEGTIVEWLVRAGDPVDEGQPLVEVETDKASVVYEAQTAGLVLELRAAEGESVRVGAPIALIGAPGERVASETRETAEVGIPAGRVVAEGRSENQHRGDGVPRPKASPLARRIAAERGVDLRRSQARDPKDG